MFGSEKARLFTKGTAGMQFAGLKEKVWLLSLSVMSAFYAGGSAVGMFLLPKRFL